MNNHPVHPDDTPAEQMPTWVKVLQAAILGVVAGLALNALLSAVGVRGEELSIPKDATPKQCKKQPPPRDAVAPQPGPSVGSVRWSLEGQTAWLQPYEIPSGD
jgi:hypothetical protein